MNHVSSAANEPATGAIAAIHARATKNRIIVTPRPSRSPARATPTNAVIETILSRSAAKYYDPAATLSDDRIRDLVRIGTSAPTSFHLQNWRFIAVRTPEAKARLRPIAWNQPAITDAAVTFIIIGQLAADDEGHGCFGDRGLIPGDRTEPSLGFRRAHGDEAPVLQVEGCRGGGADTHQLADLVVAQGGGGVVILGGAAAQDAFDDGVGHGLRCSW